MQRALDFLQAHNEVALATVCNNKPELRVFQIMKQEGVLPIAEMDYYDLNPTPPVFKHFDLISGEVSNGFVGERFSK